MGQNDPFGVILGWAKMTQKNDPFWTPPYLGLGWFGPRVGIRLGFDRDLGWFGTPWPGAGQAGGSETTQFGSKIDILDFSLF